MAVPQEGALEQDVKLYTPISGLEYMTALGSVTPGMEKVRASSAAAKYARTERMEEMANNFIMKNGRVERFCFCTMPAGMR
jgi:hypothetical protein